MARPSNMHYGRRRVHIIVWMVLFLLAIFQFTSCGTRRVNSQKDISIEKEKEQSSSRGQVKKESASESSDSSEETNKEETEQLTKRIEELYNENGTLKSRNTYLEKNRNSSANSKASNRSDRVYINTDSTFNNTVYRTRLIKEKQYIKDVDSDNSIVANVGGRGTLIVIVLIIVGSVFLYFWLKGKRGAI